MTRRGDEYTLIARRGAAVRAIVVCTVLTASHGRRAIVLKEPESRLIHSGAWLRILVHE